MKKFDVDDNRLLKSLTHLNVSISMFGQTLFSINILSSLSVTYICSILVKNQYLQLSDLLASLKLVSISTATLADSFGYLVNILSTKKIKEMVISEIPERKEIVKEEKIPQLDLRLNNLSFAYGPIKVFDKMDLDIEKSKSYAIIGNSGSGKSTLAKILMKVNEDYGGEISFANGNFKDFSEEELYDSIYYIPQNPIVFEDTFINNIGMADDGLDRDRIEGIIDRVGLSRVYHEKMDGVIKNGSLSGGEKKKLELARALYKESEVLIFDEPTSGLDPESARSIEGLIESLDNLTRIVITHNQDKAYLQSFDHVINIEDYKN
ncbi:ABC transporter ATP-binding protein [Anaerococcus tetradius]|uniref:ABC transporter ATP-binding protein n=1 Tax=Anaerococcus tetradius TaxID=33036 RepID=UPI0023F36999|nr:ABC transporter ATP-binding protein [Anaerococcus tetradius]